MKSLLIGLLFLMGGSVFTQSALASINLIWPSNGQILSKFDSNKKGIQIASAEVQKTSQNVTPQVAAVSTAKNPTKDNAPNPAKRLEELSLIHI